MEAAEKPRALGGGQARAAGLALVLAVVAVLSPAAGRRAAGQVAEKADGVEAPEFVRQRCGGCHAVPDPRRLPKDQWTETMQLMVDVMKTKAGVEYSPAEMQRLLIHYRANSPQRLERLPTVPASSPVVFEARPAGLPAGAPHDEGRRPSISNVHVVDLDGDGAEDVLVCDALGNRVSWLRRNDGEWTETVLAEVPAPAATSVVDLDGDGDRDIVVAALGSLFPTNDLTGRVVWLENVGDTTFETVTLLEGVGRLTDAVPGDLDGDGDLDLAVAVFGHITVGGVAWLENRGDEAFELHWLLEESGAMLVPLTDLDGDGDLDVVALVAQAAERIVAFVNGGEGRFAQVTVFDAGTPSFGSSGMELVDLDLDGDVDVLHSNGDSFDVVGKEVPTYFFQRPYHGVRWIENLGGFEWARHEIRSLYGAFAPTAGDLDGDGDVDVLAVSMFNDWADPLRQSVVWLENDGEQRFTAHGLGSAPTHLVTADVGDLDGDGRLDAVTGGMHVLPPYDRIGRVTWWRNLGESR